MTQSQSLRPRAGRRPWASWIRIGRLLCLAAILSPACAATTGTETHGAPRETPPTSHLISTVRIMS
ncbi:MAG TPA: hypothetical protein VFB21_08175 [Chthonomonadaceae bacterium]|nr:hypothetical protein [Chthonomonadaceae bacterium]